MSPKRFPKALAVWLVSLPTMLVLVWLSGYLYWHVRIGRAISDLRRGPGSYASDPSTVDPELLRIGSRGIPRFVAELDGALSRGDDEQALALSGGLSDLVAGFYETGIPAIERATEDRRRLRSRKDMELIVHAYRNMTPAARELFPPWWMWWRGQRR